VQLPLRHLRVEALGFLSRQRRDTAAAGRAGSFRKIIHRSSARDRKSPFAHLGSRCDANGIIRLVCVPRICLTIPDRHEGRRGLAASPPRELFKADLSSRSRGWIFGLPRNSDAIPANGGGGADGPAKSMQEREACCGGGSSGKRCRLEEWGGRKERRPRCFFAHACGKDRSRWRPR
jgi:hypothetical protein